MISQLNLCFIILVLQIQMRTGIIGEVVIPQIKTFNSQQSNIDLFSKLQSSFLEKFFKYNLSDYFPEMFANLYEDLFNKKINNKVQKSVCMNMFITNRSFMIEQFRQKIEKFYHHKSKSIMEGELPYAFQFKYCNKNPVPNMIKENQLILFQVKIKAEVQKIEEFPQKIEYMLSHLQGRIRNTNNKQSPLQMLLHTYKFETISIFLVYFGDCNFDIFKKGNYEKFQKITLMNKTFKVRIFVFFISRQALVQSFRAINKINNLQYINDLVIQFYELKREKQRRKRNREHIQLKVQDGQNFLVKNNMIVKVAVIATIVGFGAIAMKVLF